jgi:prepilin-type N-terminal cleavage/methylation domain-containing protein/prepilin-type processing-associated H-X9-DG protein
VSGFSLIELLIVISIIGILITLLLPAVQAAREAARKTHCLNNLKQVGTGLSSFYTAKNVFPMGHYCTAKDPATDGNEATWITYLLPYIEENSLYQQIDWTKSFGYAPAAPYSNRPITNARIALLNCPSSIEVGSTLYGSFARGTYAANNGIGPMRESALEDLPLKRQGGVFYMNSKTTFAKIQDGSSKTALVCELHVVEGDDWRGVMHYPEGPFYHHNNPPNSSVADGLRQNGCHSISAAPCEATFWEWRPRVLTVNARSYHSGGVNLLLADGSVHFVRDTIDANVWTGLATPSADTNEGYGRTVDAQ